MGRWYNEPGSAVAGTAAVPARHTPAAEADRRHSSGLTGPPRTWRLRHCRRSSGQREQGTVRSGRSTAAVGGCTAAAVAAADQQTAHANIVDKMDGDGGIISVGS